MNAGGRRQQSSFERPGIGQERQAERHPEAIADRRPAHQPGGSAQEETAAQHRHRSTPVAVAEVAEPAYADHSEQSTQQGPLRGQVSLQHPAQAGGCESHAQQHTRSRCAKKALAESHEERRCRSVLRHVRGLQQNVKGFEVMPKRWSGVCQPAVSKGLAGQQVAELVLHPGRGEGLDGQQGNAAQNREQENSSAGLRAVLREAAEASAGEGWPGKQRASKQGEERDQRLDDDEGWLMQHNMNEADVRGHRGSRANRMATPSS
jgi:hypothetical protein